MERTLLIDACGGQTRLALLEEGALREYYVDAPNAPRLVGNIYKAVVRHVRPGMDACFVDIGEARNAYLFGADMEINPADFSFCGDNPPDPCAQGARALKPGGEIVVQVLKEPCGQKGARVTTAITLPGRFLVLMPTAGQVGVSRRILDEEERLRLRRIAREICPVGMGLIMRTAALGAQRRALEEEMARLLGFWEEIWAQEKTTGAPGALYVEESLLCRLLRDIAGDTLKRVVVNDAGVGRRAEELLQGRAHPKIELDEGNAALFTHFNIEGDIRKSESRRVWLKCGGYLVVDQTEAMAVVDVNTGRYTGGGGLEQTVFTTNLAAAQEIARQIRLRDLGGIIIIDFIDMAEPTHREALLKALRQAVGEDRARVCVHGMTRLGLVEVTRKKLFWRVKGAGGEVF